MVIQQVLMQTVSLRLFDEGVSSLREDLGFDLRASGPVDAGLARVWGVSLAGHPRYAVLSAPGSSRGFIRLIEGRADDLTGSVSERKSLGDPAEAGHGGHRVHAVAGGLALRDGKAVAALPRAQRLDGDPGGA